MRNLILEQLKKIEAQYQVTILFAAESGSRAWGLSSQQSDYDVRFIYIHPQDAYLSIDIKPDVIEPQFHKLSSPNLDVENSLLLTQSLDMSGWDIRKTLQLYRKSNPSLFEWLHSDIVYCNKDGFQEQMLQLEPMVFSPRVAMFQYLSTAKRNMGEVKGWEQVKVKRYLLILRCILQSRWIEQHSRMPVLNFLALLDTLDDGEIKSKIHEFVDIQTSEDKDKTVLSNVLIESFVEQEINRLYAFVRSYPCQFHDPTTHLDELFRNYVELNNKG